MLVLGLDGLDDVCENAWLAALRLGQTTSAGSLPNLSLSESITELCWDHVAHRVLVTTLDE